MPFYPPFNMPFFYNNHKYNHNFSNTNYHKTKKEFPNNLESKEKASADSIEVTEAFFEILGLKLYFDDILIISDDLDLFVGNYKLKLDGSCGGHNGLRDIENKLGTNKYKRLKIGISNDKNSDTKDYVLGKFSKDELESFKTLFHQLSGVLDDYFKLNFTDLMSKYNRKNR